MFLQNLLLCVAVVLGANIVHVSKALTPADITDVPYLASVRNLTKHICGGAIISTNTILTTAGCVIGLDTKLLTVQVGSTVLNPKSGIQVNDVIVHESYDETLQNYDLALIKLETLIAFDEWASPIELANTTDDHTEGDIGTVSGWATATTSRSLNKPLSTANITLVSNAVCESTHGENTITPNMICAAFPSLTRDIYDYCPIDIGYPLVIFSRAIGVVSWGYGCSVRPTVFAAVAPLNSWIQDNNN